MLYVCTACIVDPQHVQDETIGQERLYFFQFPNPLPEFLSKSAANDKDKGVDGSSKSEDGGKSVTFSPDTKPPAADTSEESQAEKAFESKVDGVVGQLEVYESGAVKMRLTNGMVMDVSLFTAQACCLLRIIRA
jgi:DNA-directed RNA polymerase III subunit RPC4